TPKPAPSTTRQSAWLKVRSLVKPGGALAMTASRPSEVGWTQWAPFAWLSVLAATVCTVKFWDRNAALALNRPQTCRPLLVLGAHPDALVPHGLNTLKGWLLDGS